VADPVEPALEEAAQLYEAAATEFERAAHHCRVAAGHFRDREIPRAAAHAWAAFGHLTTAERSLRDQAEVHASKSR
jgi:hypothetical protein